MNCHSACIVPIYTGKGDKYECTNWSGIILLSFVGKLYGRALIERVTAGPEFAIMEDQCGCRWSCSCML